MADHTMTQTASDGLDALTQDRMKMWTGFTNATLGVVIGLAILLILMAFFLL
jgi:hypothetical protein